MNRLLYLIPVAIFAVLAAFFIARLDAVNKGEDIRRLESVLINKPLPQFDLPALPGRGNPLKSDDLKGQVSLINMFGSWCVTCKVEHPFLMRLKAEGVIPVHGIAFNEPPEASLAWLEQDGDPYDRVGTDPDGRIVLEFGLTAAPETFIIGKDGLIHYRFQGALNKKAWDAEIWPLIQELRK